MVILAFMVTACITSIKSVYALFNSYNDGVLFVLLLLWGVLLISILFTVYIVTRMVLKTVNSPEVKNHAYTAYVHVLNSMDGNRRTPVEFNNIFYDLSNDEILNQMAAELYNLSLLTEMRHKQIKNAYRSLCVNIFGFAIVVVFDIFIVLHLF